jgi:Family of unknown function (DUF6308)
MNKDMLDFTAGFSGDILGPVRLDDAIRRVVAFCCSPQSGFLGYDLAGAAARSTGRLAEVGPWTILLAEALAGRVTVGNVHGFVSNIREFAELLAEVRDKDLALLDDRESAAVTAFCSFGFAGAWAPKITKVGALFRPKAIPIMDGYLALAFGYSRDAFSVGAAPRRQAIHRVITALAAGILANEDKLQEVRSQAADRVPAVTFLSDLRLADVIIWTAQDDRMERPGKPRDVWLQMKPREPPTIADVAWVPLGDH